MELEKHFSPQLEENFLKNIKWLTVILFILSVNYKEEGKDMIS